MPDLTTELITATRAGFIVEFHERSPWEDDETLRVVVRHVRDGREAFLHRNRSREGSTWPHEDPAELVELLVAELTAAIREENSL